jgi:hypothetical protein
MMRAIFTQRSVVLSLAVVSALLHGGSAGAQAQFEQDFDDTTKPWQEIAVQLPAMPNRATLVRVYVSPTATQTFSVAPETVSVGSDDVVRYVLVARSESGADNTSYEGLRCTSLEHKSYAFGHADGSWTRSRRTDWVPISGSGANRQHAALAESYFCDGHMVAGQASDIVKRLKSGRVLR